MRTGNSNDDRPDADADRDDARRADDVRDDDLQTDPIDARDDERDAGVDADAHADSGGHDGVTPLDAEFDAELDADLDADDRDTTTFDAALDASLEDAEADVPWQRASARDLQLFPPTSERCAVVRDWLRDYADNDLEPALREEVDEHVHACSDCDRALSRAELEVVRLRQALPRLVPPPEPPAGFTSRVMAEVRIVAQQEVTEEVLADFTPQVLARVRREWSGAPSFRERFGERLAAGLHGGRKVWWIAAVLFVAFTTAVLWPRQTEPARVQVVEVSGVVRLDDANGVKRRIVAGMTIERADFAAGGTWTVDAGGSVLLSVPYDDRNGAALGATSVPTTPAATIGFEGGSLTVLPASASRGNPANGGSGSVEAGNVPVGPLRDGLPEALAIARGALDLMADHPVTVRVGDESSLLCSPGSFRVDVFEVERLDRTFANTPLTRVRVEVLDGSLRILRGQLSETTVAAGTVAHFDARSQVWLEPSATRFAERLRPSNEASGATISGGPGVQQRAPTWVGRAVDATTGTGIAAANVHVWTGNGRQVVVTDQDGQFVCMGLDADAAMPVIVHVTAPSGRLLADYGPEPLALARAQAVDNELRLPPVVLVAAIERRGQLLTHDGNAVAGATIVPVVLDGLTRTIEPLRHLAVVTDESGRFLLAGLPGRLDPHVWLGAVAEIERKGLPQVAAIVLGERDLVRWQLPSVRDVVFQGLPANADLVLCEALDGLPEGFAFRRHRVSSDARGEVRIADVAGPVWVQMPSGGPRATQDVTQDSSVRRVGDVVRGALAATLDAAALTKGDVNGDWSARLGHRLARVLPSGSGVPRYVSAHADGGPFAKPGTRIYLRTEDGELWFVGEYDGLRAVQFTAPSSDDYTLIGVGPDGAIGWVSGDGATALLPLPMPAVGSAAPSVTLRERLTPLVAVAGGPIVVRFDWLDGPMPDVVFHRVLGLEDDQAIEGLPAGRYRFQLPDGARGTVEIRSGERTELTTSD